MITSSMIQGKVFLLLCLLFELLVSAASGNEPPVITTSYGKLKGKHISVKGTDQAVNGYFRIPFAKPPVGPLRFSPPERAEPWTGVRDATAYPPICMQFVEMNDKMFEMMNVKIPKLDMSEDCLYLNIYVPAGLDKKARLPVMVWIHGGGLMVGAATYYDGSALSAYENVVVVGIQYRLGVLGFFSTSDQHARGNWGFLDQVAALHWVQENIASFGGNPDSVTIFGESAGGISVSAQIVSPLSNGLFHRAISESGVVLLPGLFSNSPDEIIRVSNVIARFSNCERTSSESTVSCMRKKTKEEILEATLNSKLAFIPFVVDGVFLPRSPGELLAGQEYHPVPYLLGVNNDEFGWLLPNAFFNLSASLIGMDKEKARKLLSIFTEGFIPEHVDLYIDEYIRDSADPIEARIGFLEILADSLFVLPCLKVAKFHRESGQPIYMYEFQHRPSTHKDSKPNYVKADHTDEIGYVFGASFQTGDTQWRAGITEEEKRLSRKIMSYWANFARKGNPNGDGLHEWPIYDHQEKYLEIGLEQKIGKKLKHHRTKFWTEIYPKKVDTIIKKEHFEL